MKNHNIMEGLFTYFPVSSIKHPVSGIWYHKTVTEMLRFYLIKTDSTFLPVAMEES
jgi:hypothetical protein